jgi:hypothetical protein
MRELDRIAEQLQRAYGGDAWYGPSVRAALNGVDASVAAAARYVSLHGLVQHHVYHAGQISLLKKATRG